MTASWQWKINSRHSRAWMRAPGGGGWASARCEQLLLRIQSLDQPHAAAPCVCVYMSVCLNQLKHARASARQSSHTLSLHKPATLPSESLEVHARARTHLSKSNERKSLSSASALYAYKSCLFFFLSFFIFWNIFIFRLTLDSSQQAGHLTQVKRNNWFTNCFGLQLLRWTHAVKTDARQSLTSGFILHYWKQSFL